MTRPRLTSQSRRSNRHHPWHNRRLSQILIPSCSFSSPPSHRTSRLINTPQRRRTSSSPFHGTDKTILPLPPHPRSSSCLWRPRTHHRNRTDQMIDARRPPPPPSSSSPLLLLLLRILRLRIRRRPRQFRRIRPIHIQLSRTPRRPPTPTETATATTTIFAVARRQLARVTLVASVPPVLVRVVVRRPVRAVAALHAVAHAAAARRKLEIRMACV